MNDFTKEKIIHIAKSNGGYFEMSLKCRHHKLHDLISKMRAEGVFYKQWQRIGGAIRFKLVSKYE
ncbi:hypothetical protein [Thiocapsa sp. N5-Cardenillas]|uniref:hypothetical protein n=1 Tax=Thiocapsa sp. N5-Cardenillas TaxID=3137397 RepID=UPI0035B053D7